MFTCTSILVLLDTRSFIEVIFVTLAHNTQIHVQPNLTHHLFSQVREVAKKAPMITLKIHPPPHLVTPFRIVGVAKNQRGERQKLN